MEVFGSKTLSNIGKTVVTLGVSIFLTSCSILGLNKSVGNEVVSNNAKVSNILKGKGRKEKVNLVKDEAKNKIDILLKNISKPNYVVNYDTYSVNYNNGIDHISEYLNSNILEDNKEIKSENKHFAKYEIDNNIDGLGMTNYKKEISLNKQNIIKKSEKLGISEGVIAEYVLNNELGSANAINYIEDNNLQKNIENIETIGLYYSLFKIINDISFEEGMDDDSFKENLEKLYYTFYNIRWESSSTKINYKTSRNILQNTIDEAVFNVSVLTSESDIKEKLKKATDFEKLQYISFVLSNFVKKDIKSINNSKNIEKFRLLLDDLNSFVLKFENEFSKNCDIAFLEIPEYNRISKEQKQNIFVGALNYKKEGNIGNIASNYNNKKDSES